MNIIATAQQHESYGIAQALLVSPADPDRSLVYQRMLRTAGGRMPPLATSVVDEKHAQVVKEWIEQMKR
jgi:hypothetical protein